MGGKWCPNNGKNDFGYEHHFNLNDCSGKVKALGWDNPIVDFEQVPCPTDYTPGE